MTNGWDESAAAWIADMGEISYLSLIDIPDVADAIAKMTRVLESGVTLEHEPRPAKDAPTARAADYVRALWFPMMAWRKSQSGGRSFAPTTARLL